MGRSTGGRAGSGSPRRRAAPEGGSNGASGTTGAMGAGGANGARPGGGEPSIGALRAEAAALQERADLLTRTGKSVEVRLGKLIVSSGGRMTPQIRTLRAAAQETLALLEDTAKRQEAIRLRIAQLEAATAPLPPPPPAPTEARPLPSTPPPSPMAAAPQTVSPDQPPVEAQAPAQVPDAPVEAPPGSAAPDARPVEPVDGPVSPQPAASPAPPAPAALPTAPPAERPEPATALPESPIRRQELEPIAARTDTIPASFRRLLRFRHLATAILAALLVGLAILLTPLPELFGWQLYAVQSGSMEPAIRVGSIVGVRQVPASTLRVNDVITFADRNRPEMRVTHRIVALETREGQQVAITKGDANNTTDSWNVPVQSAIGRVEFSIPYLGYISFWLSSPAVRMAALLGVLALLAAPALTRRGRRAAHHRTAEPPPSYDALAEEIDTLLRQAPPSEEPAPPVRKARTRSSTEVRRGAP